MREWIEWLAFFQLEFECESEPVREATWQSQLNAMRLISDLQRVKT
jgi:hypothetical protein